VVPPPHADDHGPIGSCRSCSAPLAADQRYCLDCGTRRGPISDAVRTLIGSAAAVALAEPVSTEAVGPRMFAMPTPRSAAVAIAGVLAFGVLIGSIASPPAESAGAPIVVAVSPPAAAQQPVAAEEPVADEPAPAEPAAPQPQTIYVQAPSAPAQTPAPAKTPPPPLEVPPLPKLPPIQHVYLVMLSSHGYDSAFGPDSQAPYLSKTLPEQGEVLPNYYAVTKGGLANEIALLSGQGPNPDTAANCPQYTDVMPGTPGADGQAAGSGCVYPAATKTLPDQLFALGYTWKTYVEDLANGGPDTPQTCRHPDPGSADPFQQPRPGDAYVTWRNPVVYFHSLLDPPASTCNTNNVDLKQLSTDLQQVGDTAAVSLIIPNRCHDGSDEPCAPDQPAGLAAADTFLQTLIPQIQNSPGYKQGGLIAITFDQAPQDGPQADSSSCCETPAYANLPADGGTTPTPPAEQPPAQPGDTTTPTPAPAPADPTTPAASASDATTPGTTTTPTTGTTPAEGNAVKPTGGGGRVGMVLLSPYILPKSVNTTGYYNHFSFLRSIEDLFGLEHLGYAAAPNLPAFDDAVYTGYNTDS
jgi:phosphatidylinositol-3-phosphatase